MTPDDLAWAKAKAQLQQQFGWTPDYAEKALAYYEAVSSFTSADDFVNAFQQQSWRDALAAWNPRPEGGQTMPIDPDVQRALDDINKRIADQTMGLRRVVEGRYQGADGAAGIVVALEGGNTSINPQPDNVPNP